MLALSLIAQPAQAPVFEVVIAGSATVQGPIERIDPDWTTSLQGGSAGKLVGLSRVDRPRPGWPRGPQLILANGDRIAGLATGGDDTALRFAPRPGESGAAADWSIPLTTIAAVWLTAPPPDAATEPVDYVWAASAGRRDAVLLRNGDVLRGTIEAFDATPALRVKAGGTISTVPLAQVSALAFDPTLARVRKPSGTFARAVLTDGTRISLKGAKADAASLTGTSLTGGILEVPLSRLVALDVLQGKAAYLSDLKPRSAKTESYTGLAWPWIPDRSAKGQPLRVASDTFDRGLGTHPRTTLIYDLGGKYRRFEATVGLDPTSGRRGTAEVQIRVDGKAVAVEGLKGLTAAASPVRVAVDVAGAKELTLVIGFGPAGDVQADVNWGNARLIE